MLNVEQKKPPKTVRGFRLDDKTWKTLNDLADHYNSTTARIIEAMVDQYGMKVLEQANRDKSDDS